jgi:hypothetical protein
VDHSTIARWVLRLHLSAACAVAKREIRPRVINVDGHPTYARAVAELTSSGELVRHCRCRPCPYLSRDHRFIRKRIAASAWFRSVEGALHRVAGYEAMQDDPKGANPMAPQGRCCRSGSNSPCGSSALSSDHRSRRFDPRPLHAICDRSNGGRLRQSRTGTGALSGLPAVMLVVGYCTVALRPDGGAGATGPLGAPEVP